MRSLSKTAGSIVIADGYGIRVTVRHGRLHVADGIGRNRRERTYSRIGDRPSRLVVIGHAGYITLEALRWLNDVGAGLVHLHRDGTLIATSARLGLDDPRLRRLQSKATETCVGVEITREIMRAKLAGQADALASVEAGDENDHDVINWARRSVESATSLDELRTAESQAAVAYWRALALLPIRFGKADSSRVPEHWLTIGRRRSPFAAGARQAVTPYHALTNYAYALLEAEARLACHACGLDPGLGVIHADQKARDSLALDLMEAVRPEVDAYILKLTRERTFRARDFYESRRGSCRILAPLTVTLAETISTWRAHIAPVAETVARMLVKSPGSRVSRSLTPLTQTNRRTAHPRLGNRKRGSLEPPAAQLPDTCRACGVGVPTPTRRFCDACLDHERTAEFKLAGPAALAKARAAGIARDGGAQTALKRGNSVSRQLRASRAWERDNSIPDPGEWGSILAGIQEIPLSKLMEATGLSLRYVSLIRRGEKIPHPRHWQPMRLATSIDAPESVVRCADNSGPDRYVPSDD